MQGARVPPLVRELSSHVPRGKAKKNQKPKKTIFDKKKNFKNKKKIF